MGWGQERAVAEREMLPTSIEELEEMRLTLMEEIAEIQSQFAQRKALLDEHAIATGNTDRYGKPMADPAEYAEYTRWRGSAAGAVRWKQIELSNINGAIKDVRNARGMTGNPQAAVDVQAEPLAALYRVAKRLAGRVGWDKVDDADKGVLDAIRATLTHGQASPSASPAAGPLAPAVQDQERKP